LLAETGPTTNARRKRAPHCWEQAHTPHCPLLFTLPITDPQPLPLGTTAPLPAENKSRGVRFFQPRSESEQAGKIIIPARRPSGPRRRSPPHPGAAKLLAARGGPSPFDDIRQYARRSGLWTACIQRRKPTCPEGSEEPALLAQVPSRKITKIISPGIANRSLCQCIGPLLSGSRAFRSVQSYLFRRL